MIIMPSQAMPSMEWNGTCQSKTRDVERDQEEKKEIVRMSLVNVRVTEWRR